MNKGKNPVRYADIGVARSEAGERFRDRVIEESSPSSDSDEDYNPQQDVEAEQEDDDGYENEDEGEGENEDEDEDEGVAALLDDDALEKECMQTLQERAVREKAYKVRSTSS